MYSKPPGRMKTEELIEELVTVHGKSREELADVKWNALIHMAKAARAENPNPPAAEDMDCEHLNYDPPTRLCISCGARAPEDKVLTSIGGRAVPEGTGVLTHENVEESEAEKEKRGGADDEVLTGVVQPEERPKPLLIINPDNKDYVFAGHAGMGPSGASRWMSCTASVEASREFLSGLTFSQQEKFAEAGTPAQQGTTAHSAAEVEILHALGQIKKKKRDKALAKLADLPADIAYNETMKGHLVEYVDLVMGYHRDYGMEVQVEVRVETKVPLSNGETYTIKGSTDAALLPSDDHPGLVVIDLKYGSGHDVDPDNNPQAMTYAGGVIQKYKIARDTEVTIVIAQPRLGGVKAWKTTAGYILDWIEGDLSKAVEAALAGVEGGAEFNPNEEACTFCPASPACKALLESRTEKAREAFKEITAAHVEGDGKVDTSLLSDERLGEVLESARAVFEVYDNLKDEAERRMQAGRKIPGAKLIAYTPHRMWADGAKEALAEIEGVWKPPTLESPNRAIAAVGDDEKAQELLAKYIVVPDKRPIYAPASSKKAEWQGATAADLFDDVSSYEVAEPKKAKKKSKKKKGKK